MSQSIPRAQILKSIRALVAQSELFPTTISEQAEALSDEALEKLIITLHAALKTEQNLSPPQREQLEHHLTKYHDGKRRIYQQAEAKWREQQEANHEAQESLFEASLLAQL